MRKKRVKSAVLHTFRCSFGPYPQLVGNKARKKLPNRPGFTHVQRGRLWGGKTKSICHFPFSLVLQCLGLSRCPDAGKKTARKASLSNPFSCAPNLATPPVRLGLSGRNSGKIPERPRKRSQSVSWNSRREYGWDAPKPYNSRHLMLPEHFQNYLPPQYGWGRFFFQKWFRRGPPRAGHGIPSSTGGISDLSGIGGSPTFCAD